jgi:hypothetical protein
VRGCVGVCEWVAVWVCVRVAVSVCTGESKGHFNAHDLQHLTVASRMSVILLRRYIH